MNTLPHLGADYVHFTVSNDFTEYTFAVNHCRGTVTIIRGCVDSSVTELVGTFNLGAARTHYRMYLERGYVRIR